MSLIAVLPLKRFELFLEYSVISFLYAFKIVVELIFEAGDLWRQAKICHLIVSALTDVVVFRTLLSFVFLLHEIRLSSLDIVRGDSYRFAPSNYSLLEVLTKVEKKIVSKIHANYPQ